jgi:hypothetical protein
MNKKYWLKLKPKDRFFYGRGHHRSLSKEEVVTLIKKEGVLKVNVILHDDTTPDGGKNNTHLDGKEVLEIWKAYQKNMDGEREAKT